MSNRRFDRPRHPRTIGRKVLIVCEGQKTERGYFEALRRSMRLPTMRIRVVHPNATDPLTIVESTIEERAKLRSDGLWFATDEAWVVFDGDEHISASLQRWNRAIQLARDNGIRLAVSNPCFELWYLIHFQDQTANLDRASACRRLRTHIASYAKSDVLWPTPLQALTAEAVRRSEVMLERARRDELGEFVNPSTGVHELVQVLLALAQ